MEKIIDLGEKQSAVGYECVLYDKYINCTIDSMRIDIKLSMETSKRIPCESFDIRSTT